MTKTDRELIEWLDEGVCFCRVKDVHKSDTYITCDRCKKKTPRLHWTCDSSGDKKVYYNHMAGIALTLEFMLEKILERRWDVTFGNVWKDGRGNKDKYVIMQNFTQSSTNPIYNGKHIMSAPASTPTLALRGAIELLVKEEEKDENIF